MEYKKDKNTKFTGSKEMMQKMVKWLRVEYIFVLIHKYKPIQLF